MTGMLVLFTSIYYLADIRETRLNDKLPRCQGVYNPVREIDM
jgi:hypothetical protein